MGDGDCVKLRVSIRGGVVELRRVGAVLGRGGVGVVRTGNMMLGGMVIAIGEERVAETIFGEIDQPELIVLG